MSRPRLRTKMADMPTFRSPENPTGDPYLFYNGTLVAPGGSGEGYSWGPQVQSVFGVSELTESSSYAIETMADIVGNPKGFNEVLHWKRPLPKRPPDVSPTLWGVTYAFEGVGTPDPTSFGIGQVPVVDPSVLSAFGYDSFYGAATQFSEQVSLGLVAWEFPELADLPKLIGEWKSVFASLQGLLKGFADKFLGYEFGVSPTISDGRKLVGVFEKFRKRLKLLQQTQGKTFKAHLSREITSVVPCEYEDELYHSSPYEAAYHYWAYPHFGQGVVRHKLVSNIVVRNNLSGLDDLVRQMDAFAAMLGLNNPGKILWDHMPYSFLIGWFAKLDNVFRDLVNNPVAAPFEGQLEIVEASYSVKSTVERPLRAYFPSGGDSSISVAVTYDFHVMSQYERRSGIPLGDYISFGDDLSAMQKTLLAALISQRLPDWLFPTRRKRTRRRTK
jgi:hypothetical protein